MSLRVGILLWLHLWAASARAGAPGSVSGQVVTADAAGPQWVFIAEMRGRRESPQATPRSRIELRERQFVPAHLVLLQGHIVDFVNRDRGYHSVFSRSPGNEFDLGLEKGEEPRSVEMRAPGEVEVHCDLHPEMAARILVLQNEHHAQVGPGGTYTLPRVPAGSYALVAWSPWHEPERRRIIVREGGVTEADFTLRPRKSPEAHLDRRSGL